MLRKDHVKNRLDSHSLLLRALVEVLSNAGVINQQQLREKLISRSLVWRIKALRDILKMLD